MAPLGLRLARALVATLLLAVASCSLLVDSSDLDADCTAAQKWCDGHCVDRNDPRFGCEPGFCEACALPNTIPTCKNGHCAPQECLFGFGCADCTVNVLTDNKNCGTCGNDCHDKVCKFGQCELP